MQAAGAQVKLDAQITESEWAAMKQGIWPSALVHLPAMDPAERKETMREFNDQYAGASKTGKAIGIPDWVKVEWPPIKPREMGYAQSAERMRDQILAIMRVPAAILGLSKEVNRASAEALTVIFARWCIAPKLVLLQDQINLSLTSRFGEDVWFEFRNPVPEDQDLAIRKSQMELSTYTLTVNEYRATQGLPAVPWGDKPMVPFGLAPLGEGPAAPPPVGKAPQALPLYQALVAGSVAQARYQAHKLQFMLRLRKVIRRWFEVVAKRVLEAWDADAHDQSLERQRLPKRTSAALDSGALASDLVKQLKPLLREGIYLGGAFNGEFLPPGARSFWKPESDAIDRYMEHFSEAHFLGVADTTRLRIKETVAEGMQEHETWQELRERIEVGFGQMEEFRSANIATTETTDLYGAGGQAFREEAEVPAKEWVASFVNTRDTHAAAHGQVRANDEEFDVGTDHMQFPGDGSQAEENCNCNCIAIPAFKTK
jgi:hypothetical protein